MLITFVVDPTGKALEERESECGYCQLRRGCKNLY